MKKMFMAIKGLPLMDGLEIKALKKFKGHANEDLYKGNLYLIRKKIAHISDDYSNGLFHIDVNESNQELYDEIEAFIKENGATRKIGNMNIETTPSTYFSYLLQIASLYKEVLSNKDKRVYVYDKGDREGKKYIPECSMYYRCAPTEKNIKEIKALHPNDREILLNELI